LKNFKGEIAQKLIDHTTTIFWLRRDLRLNDSAALYYALKENKNILAVFVFDSIILDKLENKQDKRLVFIHQTLALLKQQLEEFGSSLLTWHGDPVVLYKTLNPKAVYANHDYEPYAIKRDGAIAEDLLARGIPFKTYKDHVIFEKNEIVKDNSQPYTIFTPYSKKWKAELKPFAIKIYPTEKYYTNFKTTSPLYFPSLRDLGFSEVKADFPERAIKQNIIEKYDQQRDHPALAGTTKLSVHLRFGTVSIRKLVQVALKKNQVWLNELIWRDFYHMILWHFPQVETQSFKPAYDHIDWRNNPKEFEAWCTGMTGYPIVDAGMRELNQTGFMHNRVRMVVASFLTKHLLIDWRLGEAYFAQKLNDYDLAANNGGWQWAAGSGCDAAPYFRVFNPELQTKRFDPDMTYCKEWIPELGTPTYPSPIVDHAFARERVLRIYKKALSR